MKFGKKHFMLCCLKRENKMKLTLIILIVAIYWCLDAYQAVLNFDISFAEAFLLDYDQSNPILKLIIVVAIFILSAIQIQPKADTTKEKEGKERDLNTIDSISDIILAPIPLHKQLNSIVYTLEEELNVKSAFIASFTNDTILLLNTNESLNKIGIKMEYKPYHSKLKEGSIEKLLSSCFLEKREYEDSFIDIKGATYRVLLQTYKGDYSKKSIGVAVMLLEKSDKSDYKNFLKKVCEQIAFTINLTKKKESAIKAQNSYNAKFMSIDTDLNIVSNSKLQEAIGHEINRSQRYKTELSIMLIEIDHIENIKNIFNEKETLALLKEFATLLKKSIRDTDMLSRWGDNSFVIIAPDIDFRATKSFANKLNRELEEHRFFKVGKLTCSYGITSFSPKDSIDTFRKRAENALKKATSRGGNSIETRILV